MKVQIARHTVAITLGEHKSIGLDTYNNQLVSE